MTTTWNASDKSASVTLSNGNLTATTTSTNQGVRSTTSHGSGKWYAEFYNCFFSTVPSFGSRGGIGIADSSYVLTNGPGGDNTHSGWCQEGQVIVGNATKSTGGLSFPITTLSVVGVAVDMDNHLLWITTDGVNWNNGGTANPVTGIGGYSLVGGATTLGPNVFLAAYLRWNGGSPNDNATLRTDTGFSYTVPVGFNAWDFTENSSDEAASSDHLLAEAASSDLLAHERASSDLLAAERASSDHLLAEAASSDLLATERVSSDEAASSNRLLAELASSDHLLAEQASSSDYLLHEQQSSDDNPAEQASSSDHLLDEQASSSDHEQASSELQSDLTHEIPPPIQVVAIVS